ncbi:hypothetical protein FACS1894122_06270 [Alphaproteobacteria bacterium]|nr:hypothetical protein FACS1894122_06270 [Alphaproteobacteria bacterium]
MSRKSHANSVFQPMQFYYRIWDSIICIAVGAFIVFFSLTIFYDYGLECASLVGIGLVSLLFGLVALRRRFALEISDDKIKVSPPGIFNKIEEIDKNALIAIVSIDTTSDTSLFFIGVGDWRIRTITILISDKYGYRHINVNLEFMSRKNAHKATQTLNDICEHNRKNIVPSDSNHTKFSESNAKIVINNLTRNEGKNKWHNGYLEFFADRKKLFFKFIIYALLLVIPCYFACMLLFTDTTEKYLRRKNNPFFC